MKSGVLFGVAVLAGLVLLNREAPSPSPSPPSLPPHRAPEEVALSASPSTGRTFEMPTPQIIQAGVPRTFHAYDCTIDCSGHEAGYEWAEQKGIDDPDDCGGNSESFIEGCRAYAEEQQEEAKDDDDDDGDGEDDEE